MAANRSSKNFFIVLFSTVLFLLLLSTVFLLWSSSEKSKGNSAHSILREDNVRPLSSVSSQFSLTPRDTRCTFHTCLDVYHCGYNDQTKLSIYVYPVEHIIDDEGLQITPSLSQEYFELLTTILDSPYYTNNPEKACLFVPSIDLLNQNNLRLKEIGLVLSSLKW